MQRDKNFTEHHKLLALDVKYIVNEDSGVVVAKATFRVPYMPYYTEIHEFTTVGVAMVNRKAGDRFDVEKGKRLARAKAEKDAFLLFKQVLMKQRKETLKDWSRIENSIDRMKANIQNQNEYIKSF